MVSVSDPGSSGPGMSPGRKHCIVFLDKTLNSHSASLLFEGSNLPSMDKHAITRRGAVAELRRPNGHQAEPHNYRNRITYACIETETYATLFLKVKMASGMDRWRIRPTTITSRDMADLQSWLYSVYF